MLSDEIAEQELKKQQTKAWSKQLFQRIGSLKKASRDITTNIIGRDEKGRQLLKWDDLEEKLARAARFLDESSDIIRRDIFSAIGPQVTRHIETAWELLKRSPYQVDYYRKGFRTPNHEEYTRAARGYWLHEISDVLAMYQKDITWVAQWAPYFADNSTGILLAAAIDNGGEEGERVLAILRESANGEHEIGAMGNHIIRAFLCSSNPEGWEYMEKMLLAAQRQEGLRQSILEAIDEAHPEAFRRMLRLILEENLVRFSSVVRAADVWFKLNWDAASTGVIKECIEKVLRFLDDPSARQSALESDKAEDAYFALWTLAFEDVFEAIPVAERMLSHRLAEIRFTGLWMLRQMAVLPAQEVAIQALEDEDVRVSHLAMSIIAYRNSDVSPGKNLFDRLEGIYPKYPEKKTKYKPLLWPWLETTTSRQDVANALRHNLGALSIDRILPYVPAMDASGRGGLAHDLAGKKKWTGTARKILLQFLGDSSSYVRETVIQHIDRLKIEPSEVEYLETLLKRKVGDLRRGVIKLMMTQKDKVLLESADRLLGSKVRLQREGGLELLHQMKAANRSSGPCRERALAYQDSQKNLSQEEKGYLGQVLETTQEKPSLKNALGLADLSQRSKARQLRKHKMTIVTPVARECILTLDKQIHAYREHPVKNTYNQDETLIGHDSRWVPYYNDNKSLADNLAALPLQDVWMNWWKERPDSLRDGDDLELVQMWGMAEAPMQGWRSKPWKGKHCKELYGDYVILKTKYWSHIEYLLPWLIRVYPAQEEVSFLLRAAETSLSLIPPDRWKNELRGYDTPYTKWLDLAGRHRHEWPERWDLEHEKHYWELLKWIDEPISSGLMNLVKVSPPRERVNIQELYAAYDKGFANESDLYDDLLGEHKDDRTYNYQYTFSSLHHLTSERFFKELEVSDKTKRTIKEMLGKCRDRILEIELKRGDTPTTATAAALAIRSMYGADKLVLLLQALGRGIFLRGWSKDSLSKNAVFSDLIRVCLPNKSDSLDSFAQQVEEAGISKKRLLELAVFAPQWAQMVEHALEWEGLEDAVWWIHAHTKDRQWTVEDHVRDTWAAKVTERTPLTAEDLMDGAVDVQWFRQVYKQLGPRRWQQLHACSKFASGGAGHKRAEQFSEAMLDRLDQTDLIARIRDKRHQDTVRALGLVPLPRGKKRENAILERYQVMQEFTRTSRQFGSQRQASEKRAANIGQENLARTAGYADPIRLQWAMEAHAVADLADGPIEISADSTVVALQINEFGEVDLSISKDGKSLKSVPAKLRQNKEIQALRKRKTELKRQASRMRSSLETMMCRKDTFTGSELAELWQHPIIRPVITKLVFVGKDGMGYPAEGGKVLVDHKGKKEVVGKKDILTIAHPSDLLESGQWHEWQKECFAVERVQPFKQVFRELYVLTDAEKKDRKISRRYAGHQVNPRQALSLFGSRGWISDPEEGVRKTLHDQNLSVWIEFQESFFTPADIEGLTLEGIRFTRRGTWDLIPLDEIDPLVFSEVMRDMDLVVSVAHQGGVDPEASASTIAMRSDLIRETLAILSVENIRIENNHAFIAGELANYSIHLGSAVTHLMPGGSMFIVPVHSQHRGRMFLPFADDDPKTAEVLSKILLLARDKEIKDPSILNQIRRV